MTDTTKQITEEVLAWLKGARELAGEHMPDVCEQIVSRGLWYNFSAAGVLLLATLVSVFVGRMLSNLCPGYKERNEHENLSAARVCSVIFGFILPMFMLTIAVTRTVIAVGIYVAPKVYVIERLTEMVQ